MPAPAPGAVPPALAGGVVSEDRHHAPPDVLRDGVELVLARLQQVAARLAHEQGSFGGRSSDGGPAPASPDDAALIRAGAAFEEACRAHPSSPLLRTCEVLGLDAFEREVLLLALGYEVDGRFPATVPLLTVGLAQLVLPGAHWRAFVSTAPLRHWNLLRFGPGPALRDMVVRMDEDVALGLLGGAPSTPAGVAFEALDDLVTVTPSQVDAADRCRRSVRGVAEERGRLPAVVLDGATPSLRRDTARMCAELLGMRTQRLDLRSLPASQEATDHALRSWSREALLHDWALYVECAGTPDAIDRDRVERVARLVPVPVFFSGDVRDVLEAGTRPLVQQEVGWPRADERASLWVAELTARSGGGVLLHDVDIEVVAEAMGEEYRVDSRSIRVAAHDAIDALAAEPAGPALGPSSTSEPDAASAVPTADRASLLRACRAAAGRWVAGGLDDLAVRIDTTWGELLEVPERQREQLDELEEQIANAFMVNRRWGLARGGRGGPSALFSGPSGTGKTLAASRIAGRLGMALHRVELSRLVSKYIGETEKNLRRVFDAAEAGGVILLFDEADALFGKRSEVKDSHDRHANIETAYLLQEMERSQATCILTTNLKDAVDPAFLRRLRFVVEFPFPDEPTRRAIWRSAFPETTPTKDLRHDRLAKLAVNGGTIRAIALRAAFLAAASAGAVEMRHVREAALRELRKLGRELAPIDVEGWV